MAFKSIALHNFRSYPERQFELHPKLTIVTGPNGIGKTNFLESLYVASTTKSWRAPDRDLITEGNSFWRLVAATDSKQNELRYDLSQPSRPVKKITLNNNPVRPEAYIGQFPTVLFEPGSLAVINGAPDDRRRFLDGVLASVDKKYLSSLFSYRRILKQRNALLRRQPHDLKEQLFAWDLKLVEAATYLQAQRTKFVKKLNLTANDLYQQISEHNPQLRFSYQSAVPTKDYSSQLLAKLSSNLQRDLLLGHTSSGPHRDDLDIRFGEHQIVSVASRGEMRTTTLVCKLIELAFIDKYAAVAPVLLLDDVLSELDARRQGFLLDQLGKHQTIITATDTKAFPKGLPKDHLEIALQ